MASGVHTVKSLRAALRLPRDFFARDATTVARELLGNLLIRREGRTLLAGRIDAVAPGPALKGFRELSHGTKIKTTVPFGSETVMG